MKLLLSLFLLGASLVATAQTSTYSTTHSQINDDDKTLSIQIDGQRNGQPIKYNRTFNVASLNKTEREALKNRVLDSLGLGEAPPTPPVPLAAATATNQTKVTFVCPTCSGKTKLAINGDGYSLERELTIKKDKTGFPFVVDMKPGKYIYTYWQNGVEQMQLPFTVKAGEPNEVIVK
ncbi:hypothetical protein [Spirosoma sp. KUDC1026]|uniref:hypothetical protein n=1 Tax=Spirosoma sp. KUDC1026 TaxID=2745947 RepID=UPI00159BC3FA|nr:hypothetical protein [Spirosoma sp. KUDC1026]QKZ12838.1 hypothetical protein HU175_09420 [Spirosoma sp. KUDC1026]